MTDTAATETKCTTAEGLEIREPGTEQHSIVGFPLREVLEEQQRARDEAMAAAAAEAAPVAAPAPAPAVAVEPGEQPNSVDYLETLRRGLALESAA